MAMLYAKDRNSSTPLLRFVPVDSDNAFGPHLELLSKNARIALSLDDEEIEAVRQWCVRVQTRRKKVDEVLAEACGTASAL